MDLFNFSDNIIRLRRSKKMTQEQLADFIGVTKASVSKWETKQSLPDVVLLPRLAAFFDVTIDELIGYEPQPGKEQIRKIYHDLAADFAQKPFEEVMQRSRDYVKRYYSCYSFLFQICVLWLNHYMLAGGQEQQMQILAEASDLCSHIIAGCRDIGICNDAGLLKAQMQLLMGKPAETIDILEEMLNPYHLAAQSDGVLIQAYMLAGKRDDANSFTQMSMYLHLLNFIADAVQYISIHSDDLDICEETIRRVEKIAQAVDLAHLHPNSDAVFRYQAALVYCVHGMKQEALAMLKGYADAIDYMLTGENISLHGDSYFDAVQAWYEKLDIGAEAPRDQKIILESAVQMLSNPVFSVLENDRVFQEIRAALSGKKTESR